MAYSPGNKYGEVVDILKSRGGNDSSMQTYLDLANQWQQKNDPNFGGWQSQAAQPQAQAQQGISTGMGMPAQQQALQQARPAQSQAIPAAPLASIQNAYDPNNPDAMYRGLTKEQYAYYSNLAHQAMNRTGNFDQYNQIMGEGSKAAADALQILQQTQTQQSQQKDQIQQQAAQRAQILAQLQAQVPVLGNQMSNQLADQTKYAYNQIDPIIQQRLNALGLLQSGALPEAQTKAFQNLQMSAQGRVQDFMNQANQQLQLQVPLMNTESDIGSQQQALQQLLGMQQAGMSRGFSQEDATGQMAQALQARQQAMEMARSMSDQASRNKMLAMLMEGGGTLAGAAIGSLGGPAGMAAGAAAGRQAGQMGGQYIQQ